MTEKQLIKMVEDWKGNVNVNDFPNVDTLNHLIEDENLINYQRELIGIRNEFIAEIVAKRKDVTLRSVGDVFGLSRERVRQIALKYKNIERRDDTRDELNKTLDALGVVKYMHENPGDTWDELAERFGVSVFRLRKYYLEATNEKQRVPRGGRRKSTQQAYDEIGKQIKAMRPHKTYAEICHELGLSMSRVLLIAREEGLVQRHRNASIEDWQKSLITLLVITSQIKLQDVADIFGVSSFIPYQLKSEMFPIEGLHRNHLSSIAATQRLMNEIKRRNIVFEDLTLTRYSEMMSELISDTHNGQHDLFENYNTRKFYGFMRSQGVSYNKEQLEAIEIIKDFCPTILESLDEVELYDTEGEYKELVAALRKGIREAFMNVPDGQLINETAQVAVNLKGKTVYLF